MSGLPAWAPVLRKRQATCLRCQKLFNTEISRPVLADDGAVLRGRRQLHWLCAACRADDGRNQGLDTRGGRRRAHAES